jgi:hypothetical protein
MIRSGNLSSHWLAAGIYAPCKQACIGVIIKNLLQSFLGYYGLNHMTSPKSNMLGGGVLSYPATDSNKSGVNGNEF